LENHDKHFKEKGYTYMFIEYKDEHIQTMSNMTTWVIDYKLPGLYE